MLRLILRMERTTNPSVDGSLSCCNSCCAITAISSCIICSFLSCWCCHNRYRSYGRLPVLKTFWLLPDMLLSFGINLNREIRKIRITRITNTVPIPMIVFRAASSSWCSAERILNIYSKRCRCSCSSHQLHKQICICLSRS